MKSDQQLLQQYIKQNSQTAFRELVNRNGLMVFSACNRILNDSHLAEDATQETFLLLTKKASSLKPDVIISGWLYKSAVWEALKINRSRASTEKRERIAAMEKEESDTDNDKNLWEDICPHLDEALTSLPKRLEEAVVLCFLRDKSRSEAAGILGCTENTLSKRISRGLHQLSRTFSKRGVTVPVATLSTILASSTTDLKAAAVISSLIQSMVIPAVSIPTATASTLSTIISYIIMKKAILGTLAVVAAVAVYTFIPEASEKNGEPLHQVEAEAPLRDTLARFEGRWAGAFTVNMESSAQKQTSSNMIYKQEWKWDKDRKIMLGRAIIEYDGTVQRAENDMYIKDGFIYSNVVDENKESSLYKATVTGDVITWESIQGKALTRKSKYTFKDIKEGSIIRMNTREHVTEDTVVIISGDLYPEHLFVLPARSLTLTEKTISQQVFEILNVPYKDGRIDLFKKFLNERLSAENWLEFYNGLYRQYKEKGESDSYLWKLFLRRTGEVAGKDPALHFYNSEHYSMAEKSLYCGFLLEGWVTSDLDGAFEWLETEIDPEFRDTIWGNALRSVAQTDPAVAAEILSQVPIEYQAKYTKYFISNFIKTEGFDKAEELFQHILNQASSGGYLDEKHITDMFRDLAYDKVLTLLESEDGNKKSAKWLAGHIGSPYVSGKLIPKTVKRIALKDTDAALEWISFVYADNPKQTAGYGNIVRVWIIQRGRKSVRDWINNKVDHPQHSKITYKYAIEVAKENPETATVWANRITDDELRARAFTEIAESAK